MKNPQFLKKQTFGNQQMHKIVFLLLFILTLGTAVQGQKNEEDINKTTDLSKFIIGKWETIQNKYTTNYLTLEFSKDKQFTYILRSEWKSRYKLEGNRLLVYTNVAILNKTTTDTFTVEIGERTLKLQHKGKKGVKNFLFYRKGNSNGENRLAGEWYTQHYNGYPADLTITKSGTYNLSEVLRAFKGNYYIKGNHFIVHSGKTLVMNMRFQKFNDDIIIYGKGPNMRMRRIKE